MAETRRTHRKAGRPKAAHPKDEKVTLYFSLEDLDMLKTIAQAQGKDLAPMLRSMVLAHADCTRYIERERLQHPLMSARQGMEDLHRRTLERQAQARGKTLPQPKRPENPVLQSPEAQQKRREKRAKEILERTKLRT